MGHQPRWCEVAIGLGSHDLGVASHAAALFAAELFPVVVFTGATSPTTAHGFPRGEAQHYRKHATELGVPESVILTEPNATNTGANFRALPQRARRRRVAPGFGAGDLQAGHAAPSRRPSKTPTPAWSSADS